ncbi:fructose permease [Weissella halotolerans]|nr:fructose permease [Weissella halotolerans]
MTQEHSDNTKISMTESIMYFVFSLLINALGNVFTIVTSSHIHPQFLGSAYWTAAQVNLGEALHISLFWTFLIFGMLTSLLNAALMHKFDIKRILGNLVFMVPFSAFIDLFAGFFNKVMPDATSWPMIIAYIMINFLGVALIATGISIYQRVNLVLHPADDLMQILRFRYFHGKAGIAMWISYTPPTIMAIVAWIMTGKLKNFGLGTLFAFLCQGSITGWADKHIFPSLKHQRLDVGE